MSLMDELVTAGVDSDEFLRNPMMHEDFVATNSLDDSSLLHSICEDFTVDLTDMKNVFHDSTCDVDTTNKNNSVLFENCAINLEQELEQSVTLTGSPMVTISDQEKFQESNLESNSLNERQQHVQVMSQLPERNMNQVEVQEVTRSPKEILSLEEFSQAFSSIPKTCDSVEMNESSRDNYGSYNKDHDDTNIENYDGSIKNCDNDDTGDYESRIKFHDNNDSGIKGHSGNSIVNYDISIKDDDTDDIVNYLGNIKGHDNNDIDYYDNSNKSHVNDDIVNYDSDIKSHHNDDIGHSDTNIRDHGNNTIDNYATNNDDDHGDNEIDNNDHDGNSSQLLCKNVVGEYDIATETNKDMISSVVNNFSPEREMEKDESNVGNNLDSHLIDMVKTEPSTETDVCEGMIKAECLTEVDVDEIRTESPTEIAIDVDMIKTEHPAEVAIDVDGIRTEYPTKTAIDVNMIMTESPTEIDVDIIMTESPTKTAIGVNMIRAESPTEIAIDVDVIKTGCTVEDSNSTSRSSNFAAEGTLNDSIRTEPSYKSAVCCNSEGSVTMSSLNCETGHRNESLVEQLALESDVEDCETFEDLALQQKAKFVKKEREVESLTKQLDDKQKVIKQAVHFGKQLLEENGELKEKVDKLEQKIIVIDEEMKNERHSSKMKLQSKEYMELQYSEEISMLQNEITQIKNDVQSYEKQGAHLNRELRNKDYLLEQSNLKEEQFSTTIKNLEKLLLEKTEEAVHYPTQSFSDDNEQQMALEKKVLELQTECTTLKSQIFSSNANSNRVEEELLRTKRRLEEKQQEYGEIRSEINSYEKTLGISQREILDLKAQLYAAQVEHMNRQDRGNSLFSEVEDRRVSAEKILMALQENCQTLKEKYNLEKQQNYKLRMQIMSLYQMNSSKGNETELEYLNCKLIQLQNEIRQLQEKIKSMEKHELQQNDKLMQIQKAFGTKENQGLIDFLNSLNDKKQKEMQVIQEKLNNLEMQYIQETGKVVNYMKKLRLAEEKAESLSYSNMKLKLQVDELLMKYKPDEISDAKADRKTKIQKIPLGSSGNIPDELKSQKQPCKPVQKVPDENQSKTNPNRRKLVEPAHCGYINPVDVLFNSPKAKKIVSMSSNVETIDSDGNKEQKPITTPSTTSQQTKKSKGKLIPRHKIIEVKAPSDANGVECAQQ